MSKTRFQSLTNKALMALALECGLKRSGTKPELQAALKSVLDAPPVSPPKSLRITSIDMGVKNLSVCQVTLARREESKRATKTKPGQVASSAFTATVNSWNTRDISEFSSSPGATQDDIPWDLRNDSLLEVAYNFVSRELLGDQVSEKPHVILLERQRHRSQGSPTVLEWVFRVNMFESILAGTVYTFKQRSEELRKEEVSRDYEVSRDSTAHVTDLFRVDPRMVADYFIRGKRDRGKKFDIKAEKIGVVGQWLEAESVNVPEFEEMVKKEALVEKQMKTTKKTTKKKPKKAEVEEEETESEAKLPRARKFTPRDLNQMPGFSPLTPQLESLASHLEVMSSILAQRRYNTSKSKKADDVADSLLQALAWYNWQYNREFLRELLENEDDERWADINAWAKENVE